VPPPLQTDATKPDAAEAGWDELCRAYPEIRTFYREVGALSAALAARFKERMIETSNPALGRILAREIENDFLARYFGDDAAVQKFARALLVRGEREAAKELNQLVKEKSTARRAEKLIASLRTKYRLDREDYRTHQHRNIQIAVTFDGPVHFYMVAKGEGRARRYDFRSLEEATAFIDRAKP